MLQKGIVKKINQNINIAKSTRINNNTTAEVEITRSSSCGDNCASCGLCPGRTAKVYAINDINASAGDTVIIDMSDKKVLGAAFLVYIVPLIMLIIGYFLCSAVFNSEGLAILTGFIFMAAAFIIIIYIDKKLKHKYTPHIVEIIDKEKER